MRPIRQILSETDDGNLNPFVNDAESAVDVEAIAARCGLDVDSRFKAVDAAVVRAEMGRLAARVGAGERLRLLCWCAPKRCHADAIADRILELAQQQQHASKQVAMIGPKRAQVHICRRFLVTICNLG